MLLGGLRLARAVFGQLGLAHCLLLSSEPNERTGTGHDRQDQRDDGCIAGASREPCRRCRRQAPAFGLALQPLGLALQALPLCCLGGLDPRALRLSLLLLPSFCADEDASM